MHIAVEQPRQPDVVALLSEHLAEMLATSPAESVHALDIAALEHPSVTFLAARAEPGGALLGIGALKAHGPRAGEVKSMRTAASARGRGVAAAVLTEIIGMARRRGMTQLDLETGTDEHFAPARRLYARHGFVPRAPFADYRDDPNSAYFGLALTGAERSTP